MYPYFPGQEPTLPGHADFLLQVFFSFITPVVEPFDFSGNTGVEFSLLYTLGSVKFAIIYILLIKIWSNVFTQKKKKIGVMLMIELLPRMEAYGLGARPEYFL